MTRTSNPHVPFLAEQHRIALQLAMDWVVQAVAPVAVVASGSIVRGNPDASSDLDLLHREELRDYWNYSAWLETTFEVSVARMAARDGSSPDPTDTATARYVEGQRLYMARCHPHLGYGPLPAASDYSLLQRDGR